MTPEVTGLLGLVALLILLAIRIPVAFAMFAVGTAAILRFARPVCYQDWPQDRLPPELRDENSRGILRQIDGVLTRDDVAG